jgi:hypothetical protein
MSDDGDDPNRADPDHDGVIDPVNVVDPDCSAARQASNAAGKVEKSFESRVDCQSKSSQDR